MKEYLKEKIEFFKKIKIKYFFGGLINDKLSESFDDLSSYDIIETEKMLIYDQDGLNPIMNEIFILDNKSKFFLIYYEN